MYNTLISTSDKTIFNETLFEPLPFRMAVLDGISVYIGKDIQTNIHSHHLLEVVIAMDGSFRISDSIGEQEGRSFILGSDVPHRFTGNVGDYHIFILMDPETVQARLLQRIFSLPQNGMQLLPYEKLKPVVAGLKKWFYSPDESLVTVKDAIGLLMQILAPFHPGQSTIDARIAHSIRIISENLEQELDIQSVAGQVFLSESRFSHLFKHQIGIPFKRYVLWRRLDLAIRLICKGASITEAAFESGFSDTAHLTRTFQDMFGLKPSHCLKYR